MLGLKRKKKASDRPPLFDLPMLAEKEIRPEIIHEYLAQGTPVWAVYDPQKKAYKNGKMLYNVLLGVELNGLIPTVSILFKKGKYLYDYWAITNGREMYFHLFRVYVFKPSLIMEICNEELSEACEVYHDDGNVAKGQLYLPHDVTTQELDNYFATHRDENRMYVGKERIKKPQN